jgi:hypothetical protein
MSTSGSWNFSVTASNIIQTAYEDLKVIEPGGTVASADSTLALDRLNKLVKQIQGRSDMLPGLKVWTRHRITLFLAKGQQKYLVGPASTDARATTAYGRTTLSAAEALGQTTISITSNTDTTTDPGTTVTMTASDIVGIQLDDGTIHWSTISGTPSSTMTIDDSLASAAASGNYVWWFTSRAQRFVDIESAVLRDENRNDTPLDVYRTSQAYEQGVSDKYSDGDPTCILVEPLRIATRVTLDSQPTDVTKQIVITALYPSEDYDATTDDIAYPQEYLAVLGWELAFRLSPSVGMWTPEHQANYQRAWQLAANLNPEVSDAYFQHGGY